MLRSRELLCHRSCPALPQKLHTPAIEAAHGTRLSLISCVLQALLSNCISSKPWSQIGTEDQSCRTHFKIHQDGSSFAYIDRYL